MACWTTSNALLRHSPTPSKTPHARKDKHMSALMSGPSHDTVVGTSDQEALRAVAVAYLIIKALLWVGAFFTALLGLGLIIASLVNQFVVMVRSGQWDVVSIDMFAFGVMIVIDVAACCRSAM